MTNTLLDRPLVAIAGPDDAEMTYRALRDQIDHATCRPLVVNVIQKAGGGIDKAGVQQRQEYAEKAFDRMSTLAESDGIELETDIYYGTDVADTLIEAANEVDATAIVFTSRGGSSWLDILSGGVRSSLIAKSDLPVVVLPNNDSN